jgi:PAS domain S-box-containing protein
MTSKPTFTPGQAAGLITGPPNRAETPLSDSDLIRWRAELLDPDSWGEILSRFGRTMRLAVALTDVDGNMLGPCHNPQPVWCLARKGTLPGIPPAATTTRMGPACPFCLAPLTPCSAVADASATGEVVFARDQAGLAHAAIPLFLGNQRLGTLIAGQTFAQYPQPLALLRVARECGAPYRELWDLAVHQVPVSQTTLRLYADLLASLGQAFLRQRYAVILDRRLHETDQRYRLMIEGSMDQALFTVNDSGRITSWNPGAERLLGYTESEALGTDYGRFFAPEDPLSGVARSALRRVDHGRWVEAESWWMRKDGSLFLSRTVTAQLGEGDAVEYGKLLHDVTKERETAAAGLEAQKLESIGVLAAGIAHDFNNLLTSIMGNVTLAMAKLPADDAARPLLDIAERSSRKAAALIAQLLAYAEKGDLVVTTFDLSAMIDEILPLIETSIPKNVRFDLKLSPGLPWITADASEIQQVVMNLVINGAESIGPSGGTLKVSTGVTHLNPRDQNLPDGVFLEVQDTGCGMDEATRRRIFEPFFTTKFTGRGLGLAAVSGIVRRLKARLELESEPGRGSTFRVIFSAVPALLPAAEMQTAASAVLHGRGLILIADDEPMVRNLARQALERCGYSVLTAENGQDAVEIFRRHAEIAAVLMDLTMPVMGGGEAFHRMNELRPEIPIVISSGYGENAVRERFSSALAGVIRKPYGISELQEKIAAVLAAAKTPS